MSSFLPASSEPQPRTQRRLLFEGFNTHEPLNSAHRHLSATNMLTSTPDHRTHEKDLDDGQAPESCLSQLQNARQLLHSMSRTAVQGTGDPPIVDEQLLRPEMFNDINPELAYYKSSLESERTRRKQLETLVDVQQQRLTDAESELIQLRANDHKKTLCMKQLEQMIPNVVDEWKGKETDYKSKVTTLTQQIKQLEQSQREKSHQDKQHLDEQLNEKNFTIERLNKDEERLKQEHEQGQTKIKQQEQRIQQLTKDVEQTKQRHSSLESDLRNEIKTAENQTREMQAELEKKQQDIEQILRDQHKTNNEHQIKARQLDKELDEQRRETNVLKMELELREAKYRAQTESLKIQMMREMESKIAQRLEEQHTKHVQIEDELSELQRRKLADVEEKYEQILSNERREHENRIQTLLNKLDQMKNELERLQSTTMTERQDLARKLQDVFETALFKGSSKTTLPSHDMENIAPASTNVQPSKSLERQEFLPPLPLTNNDPTNLSTIRSLSSRIDSLVDHTTRVTNGYEYSSRMPSVPSQSENNNNNSNNEWMENHQNHFLSSQPHSALHSPFFRSTPIDPMQDWWPPASVPPSTNLLSSRSHSADPSSSGLFSSFPSQQFQQQAPPSSSLSMDSHLHLSDYHQQATGPSYRSTSSMAMNFVDHQQEVQGSISKDSIERPSSTNESLSRYVKMLLERSPAQEKNDNRNHLQDHPLAKTNRSLHDIRLSIDQLNFAERDSKPLVDDLAPLNHQQSHSPRQQKPSMNKQNVGRVKKRLDYEGPAHKQSNTNELFERLSQPKVRAKKEKPKAAQPPSSSQAPTTTATTTTPGVWK